ncbi:nucleotidyltransferase domain-containing protein [Streptomyces sp. CRPSP2-6A1]|nr:nucleotidyltransferase domain-containing protein [Streptomyces sp. CRPSP2-6A1]
MRRTGAAGSPPDQTGVPPERLVEVREFLDRLTRWAATREDIAGLLLVGSYARGAARPDSDVDVVLLTADPAPYLTGTDESDAAEPGALGPAGPVNSAWADRCAPVPGGPSPSGDTPWPRAWRSSSASAARDGRGPIPSTPAPAVSSPRARARCTTRGVFSPSWSGTVGPDGTGVGVVPP